MCNDTPVISTITIHEIYSGLKYYNNYSEMTFFGELFKNIGMLDYTLQAAEESSLLTANLRRTGISINALDLMIAGTAIANNIYEIASKDNHFREIEKISDIRLLSY